ncbi:MAG TPA: SDR family oxidoreductase [Armatimonadota bacterium]|nr:SDR family oxidoreductase [Armatimonadota bacterium]
MGQPGSNRNRAAATPCRADKSLAGRVSLVTGSARGIGAHIVRRLAVCGADVAVHYRSSKLQAMDIAREIRQTGRRAEVFQADLNETSQARRLIQEVSETFGRLDHLIYSAGPFLVKPFGLLTDAEWDSILNSNLKSAWAAEIAAAPWLRRSGQGRIVNIAANSAYVRTHSIYGLAKAALIHLTEALAVELGPHVTVNCIAPGMVDGSAPDEVTEQTVLERTPLRRLVTAPEIAEMCALICGPAFASVTGRTIVMDGGRWIR